MEHILDNEYLQDCALIWNKPPLTDRQCDAIRRDFDSLIASKKYKVPYSVSFDGQKFHIYSNNMDSLFNVLVNAPNRKAYYEKYYLGD